MLMQKSKVVLDREARRAKQIALYEDLCDYWSQTHRTVGPGQTADNIAAHLANARQRRTELKRSYPGLFGAVALVIALLIPRAGHAQSPWVGQVVNAAGTTADLYTTKAALDRGAHEGFGAMQGGGMGKIVAYRVGSAAVFAFCQWGLVKTGHPRAAAWVGIGAGTAGFGAAWHNTGVCTNGRCR